MSVDGLIGVDVSSNNDSSWEDDSWDYGWVKATEGKSYKNPDAPHQLGVIRDRDRVAGHYHWLNSGSVDSQVQWFIDSADVYPGDLIACDWETDTGTGTASCAQKDDWIKQVQDHYGEANKVGLYCNKDFWLNKDTTSFAGDYLWIADPNGGSDPGIEYDWTFHQYTWEPYDKNRAPMFKTLAELQEWAGADASPEPPTPVPAGAWYSTDYLFPQVKPDPTNPHGVRKGDRVSVLVDGLRARALPGGPLAVDKDGRPIVRDKGFQLTVMEDLSDGWVTGGSNWYSSDYLQKTSVVTPKPPDPPKPPAVKPAWSKTPVVALQMAKVPGVVNYLQGVVRVAGSMLNGKQQQHVYVLAQDPDNKGDTRFLLFSAGGTFINSMTVKNGGHGQTFHAYRSAADNLYVWTLIGEVAYRIKWQPGKTITASSPGVQRMSYGTARPVGTYEHFVGFRSASSSHETFTLHDRFGFTDPSGNSSAPIRRVSVRKRTSPTQQSWAVTDTRIYRLYGATNSDPPNGTRLHVLDVLNWSGTVLLSMDVTAMAVPTSSDEPEGLTFTGTPGMLLVGKREGSSDKTKRTYPIWAMTGLP